MTKLKKLWIEEASDLSIKNELPKGLYSVSELENLSIVNFGISEISEDISKLNLKYLDLFGNNLTRLPESIVKLNFEYLNLQCNHNLILSSTQKKWMQDIKTVKIDIDY